MLRIIDKVYNEETKQRSVMSETNPDAIDVRIVSMPTNSGIQIRDSVVLLLIGGVIASVQAVLQFRLIARAEKAMKLREALEIQQAKAEAAPPEQ